MKVKTRDLIKEKYGLVAKVLVVPVALVAVFILGVNFGNGNLNIGTTNPNGLPIHLDYDSVNQEYNAIRENYDGKLTETQVLNGIKQGLAESANDPYTEYFTPSEAQSFNSQLNNSISGIGAEIGVDSGGNLEIIAPISGAPAAIDGLKDGDLITSINSKSTSRMSIGTAVTDIRGPSGTKVTLGILRGSRAFKITLTRENVAIPSVSTKILPSNIGYMQISTFANDTSSLAQNAAKQFVSDKVSGIILDLRDNPGGLLSAAINVSSLWLPKSDLILQEKTGNTVVQSYNSEGDDILHSIPTVVLIDGGSASASEITTGALHDNNQAYVIGTKSYGKGVVQELINLSGGAQLKVTVASWYRPDGQDINHKGITPDETVNLTSSDISSGNDTQLTAAENYLASH